MNMWESGLADLMKFYQRKQSMKKLVEQDSIDSGVFESDDPINEGDEKVNITTPVEAPEGNDSPFSDEELEDKSTENSNSLYEILEKCPETKQKHQIKETSKNEDSNMKYKNEKSEKHTWFLEEQEILNFIENKDQQEDQLVQFSSEFENFDEFLYYYKSFHSPLIDKEFNGFSLEHITNETNKKEEKKKEQLKKRLIWDQLQVRKDKEAISAWRGKYKKEKQKKEKEFEENYDGIDINIDAPYAIDPDWSIPTTKVRDEVFNMAKNDVTLEDVVKATNAIETELDKEVQKVIKSTDKPGKLPEEKLRIRSARIERLNEKLLQIRKKGRSLSAHDGAQY